MRVSLNRRIERWQRVLENNLGVPFTEGSEVVSLRNGVQIFPEMLSAIDKSVCSIEFLTFVYWSGDIAVKFADSLCRAAKRGVKTRVLLDSFGAQSMERSLAERMQSAGVHLEWFRPFRFAQLRRASHRTHRKILICDREFGFTGGVGIAEEWQGNGDNPSDWRETHFRLRGPVVAGLGAAFTENWLEADKLYKFSDEPDPASDPVGSSKTQVLRSSAAVGWSDVATCFRSLLQCCEERLRITTPYFVPDDACLELMCAAVKRGVRVELLLPGPHIDERIARFAARDHFATLLEAGVGIWQFQPTMIHAKIITVDEVLACIGSANFNHRSMKKDDEVLLNVLDPAVVSELDRHFDEDVKVSREIDLTQFKERSLVRRLCEKITRPIQGEL